MSELTRADRLQEQGVLSRALDQSVRDSLGAPSFLAATLRFAQREARTVLRLPEALVPGLAIPAAVFMIMLGMLDGFAQSFGIDNLAAFMLPTAVLLAVVFGSAGQNLVTDIESGYFSKVLTTPVNRLALLVGPLLADFARMLVQGSLVLLVALAAGAHIETGVAGAVVLVLVGALWGLSFTAIGFGVALKTGSGAATQALALLWVPLLYLAPAFAPRDSMADWLSTIAVVNPVTYVVEGMRSVALEGWDGQEIGAALLSIAGFGALSMAFAFLALRGRVR
jgi:ABC-2 type transport system permease protein